MSAFYAMQRKDDAMREDIRWRDLHAHSSTYLPSPPWSTGNPGSGQHTGSVAGNLNSFAAFKLRAMLAGLGEISYSLMTHDTVVEMDVGPEAGKSSSVHRGPGGE